MKTKVNKVLAAGLAASICLAGCGNMQPAVTAEEPAEQQTEAQGTTEEPVQDTTETQTTETNEGAPRETEEPVTVRIGALKGPTSIGLAGLLYENNDTENVYEYTMETQADVIIGGVVAGDFDIALIPANVASVLYQKTEGQISVIDINTLGVLYMVSGDTGITSMADLSGRTVYTTGKGSTPEYVLNYLLGENGLRDAVTVEYKSEATEVAATLAADPSAVGMLPQPFATVAQVQNENLSVVLDMTAEWDALDNGSQLVTGVTIVRNDFLETEPEAVERFLEDHVASADFVNGNPEQAAEHVVDMGIIEKAPVAQKAIPYCNIVCISGEEMKTALEGYLDALFNQDAASVGGALPGEDFYYTK